MAVPGKHDDEPRTEIQGDLYADWMDARDQENRWKIRATELRAELQRQLGTNTGGLVNGKLMVTYRYKETYAIAALIRDNPALTEHYMKEQTTSVLDIDTFALVHPEVAQRYRVRELRLAGSQVEGEENNG